MALSLAISISATGGGVLFTHPADLTSVCTTSSEFARRRDEVIACAVPSSSASALDSVDFHRSWSNDIAVTQGMEPITVVP